jgi:hypothetical protein
MKMKERRNITKKRALTAFAASIIIGALGSTAFAQSNPVSRFDNGYLAEHPEVARQLAANPSLVDNPQFMTNHPGLREYLEDHPTIRTDLKEHPYRFMSREDQINKWQEPYTGGPAMRFDNGYLKEHPEVAQQLAAHPGLVDNEEFMENHPGLREYLAAHPTIRTDLKEHPSQFMRREDQINGWRQPYYPNGGPHPMANADAYLDQHPEVAQQLNQNPRLIDNPEYIESHPGLHEFLQTHPYAKQEWKSHPYKFMKAEDRYNRKH